MRMIRLIAAIAALLLLIAVAVPFLVDADRFRPMLETALSRSLNRAVKVGKLKLAILGGDVSAADLAILDNPAFSKLEFLHAKSLKVGVDMKSLVFSRKLNVTGLTVEAPQIQLIQSESGMWNFSNLGAGEPAKEPAAPVQEAGASTELSVASIRITDGRFSLARTGGGKPLVLENVNAELRDFSATSSFPFTLSAKVVGGGEIRLEGKAGPLDQRNVAASPLQAELAVTRLDLAGSGWTQVSPGVGGLVSIDGKAESDGAVVHINGKLKGEKLKLAQDGRPAARDVEMDFALDHEIKSQAGRLKSGKVKIGSATASMTGRYERGGDSTMLHLTLDGQSMPVQELAAMLPALGVVLPSGSSLEGGTASVKLAVDGLADRLVTSGTLALAGTTLKGFDLGVKMAAIQALAGIKASPNTEIQTLSAKVRVAPEGTDAQDLSLVVPAMGELSGNGTVSPAKALDFKMAAKVHTSGMLAALAKETIPFTVTGTAADPVFRPDMKSILSDKGKTLGGKAAEGLLKGLLGRKKN